MEPCILDHLSNWMKGLLKGSWGAFPRSGIIGGPGGKSAGRRVLRVKRMTKITGTSRLVPTKEMGARKEALW